MEESRRSDTEMRFAKIKDPLVLVAMLSLSALGIAIGLSDGGAARDTLVFVIFAMTMLYMSARW